MSESTQGDGPRGPISGHLEGIGLPELLWSLCRSRKTGVLEIERAPVRRSLFIKDGRVVFAGSSDPNDRLGETLLRQGRISLDQLERALTRLRSGKRIGTLLVEEGALSSEQLVYAVIGQVRSIVMDVLQWETGKYGFREGFLPSEELITLQVGTAQILLRSARSITSFTRIRASVGIPRTTYTIAPDGRQVIEGVPLRQDEELILRRLEDGPQSIEQLCRNLALSNFAVYQTLFALRVLGVVRPQVRSAPRPEELHGRLEEVDVPGLLMRLAREEATGVLQLSRGSFERGLHFREGRCVFATSTNPDDGLVAYLFRKGVISLRDREETCRRMLSNKRVGTILREIGVIDDIDLEQMVREQVAEIVYDSFRWYHGEFAFEPGALPSAEQITLDFGPARLIAEGIRRVPSWTRVIQGCGGVDHPLELADDHADTMEQIGAGADEWKIVGAMRTAQTPRRVCRATELEDFRTCQILWTLRLLGGIRDASVDAAEFEETVATAGAAGTTAEAIPDEAELADEPGRDDRERFEELSSELRLLPETYDPAPEPEPLHAGAAPEKTLDRESSAAAEDGEQARTTDDVELPPAAEDEALPPAAEDEELPPAAATPSEPAWEPPNGIEEIILRFNEMHRLVFRAVKAQVGAGAANFVRSCCVEAAQTQTDLVSDVDLASDGSWDAEALRASICRHRIEDPWPVFQEMLDREFVSLLPHLGENQAVELKQRIWEIENSGQPG